MSRGLLGLVSSEYCLALFPVPYKKVKHLQFPAAPSPFNPPAARLSTAFASAWASVTAAKGETYMQSHVKSSPGFFLRAGTRGMKSAGSFTNTSCLVMHGSRKLDRAGPMEVREYSSAWHGGPCARQCEQIQITDHSVFDLEELKTPSKK
jgi:hypothetical protein